MATVTTDFLFRGVGAKKIQRDLKGIGKGVRGVTGGLRSMGGAMLGMAGVGGAGFMLARMAKGLADYNKKLTQLSIQGHISQKGQADLHKQIIGVASATGVARDDILSFTQGIVDATGNMQLGVDAMQAVSMAAQVTGADMQGLGTLVSDAFMKFGISGKDANKTLETLIEQGEMGRYTLNEMARTGAQAMSVAGLAGMEGVEGLREMGAMMQLIRQGFGSAEGAATGFKVMVTKIFSSESQRKMEKLGVALRDPETGKLRKFGDVFMDILKAANGDAQVLSDLFGTRGIMGVTEFGKIMKNNGGSIEAVTAELDRFRNVGGKASTLQAKFNRTQETAAVRMEKFKEQMSALVEENLLTPTTFNVLAEALDNLAISAGATSEAMKFWREKLGFDKKGDEGIKEGASFENQKKQYERIGAVAGTLMFGPMGGYIGYKAGGWLANKSKQSTALAGYTAEDYQAGKWNAAEQAMLAGGYDTGTQSVANANPFSAGMDAVTQTGQSMDVSDAAMRQQFAADIANAISQTTLDVNPIGGGGGGGMSVMKEPE